MQKFIITAIIALSLAVPALAAEPSLSVSSSAATVAVGSTFTVQIKASSNGTVVNTVAADVVFPTELVQAVSVTGPSVITIAITKSVLSDGIASIQGGIIPAMILDNDPIGTVTFKALKEGTAVFSIAPSSDIYADDGQGTNIGPVRGSVTVAIGKAAAETKPPQTQPLETPPMANIPAAPVADQAPICLKSSPQIWWQENNDLIAAGASVALTILGIYFTIKSLLILARKQKK